MNNHTAPPLFRLATRPHHVFGEVIWMAPSVSATGHEQHEKICIHCGAVKVTVIPERGDPWREWRAKGAVTQSRWPIVCEVAAT